MGCSKTYRNWECLNFFSTIFWNLAHFRDNPDTTKNILFSFQIFFSVTWTIFTSVSKTTKNILFPFQIFFSGTCSTSSCVGETKLRRKCRTRFWLLTNSGATSVPWLTSATKIKYNWNIMRNIIHHQPKIFHKKNILWYNYNHYPEMPLK